MKSIDGISQYNSGPLSSAQGTAAAGADQVRGARTNAMTPGSVFEGTILDIKDGQAVIGLSNGQTMNARLEAGMNLRPGEPMLFEVKSNDGIQVSIRPVSVESAQNPTLSKALTAAGLSVTDKNLSMVNAMMQNQMPIDKTSLQQMLRLMQGNPQANVETLAQMKRLGLPIQQDLIEQFENYKSGHHALMEQFDSLMDALPEMPQGSGVNSRQILAFHQQLLGVFGQNQGQQILNESGFSVREKVMPVTPEATENNLSGSQDGMKPDVGIQGNQQGQENAAAQTGKNAAGPDTADGFAQLLETAGQTEGVSTPEAGQTEGMPNPGAAQTLEGQQAGQGPETDKAAGGQQISQSQAVDSQNMVKDMVFVKDVLNEKQMGALEQQLRQLPGMEDNPILFQEGRLNRNASVQEMLKAMQDVLMQQENIQGGALKKLFSGKEYKALLRQVMEQQWLLTPEDVADKNNVEKLYQRMERQMKSLEALLGNSGREAAELTKNTSSVRSNLEFMQQVNQLYNYIQIPLKLTNQNAHSELYVYTNKKSLKDKEGELSALLHLELDHLGTTDVYVKLVQNKVDANFSVNGQGIKGLLESHMTELNQRLEEKGYECSLNVEERREEVDFVEDFLEREKPAGKLHRYSFDVLA